jgi:hypothetical protein
MSEDPTTCVHIARRTNVSRDSKFENRLQTDLKHESPRRITLSYLKVHDLLSSPPNQSHHLKCLPYAALPPSTSNALICVSCGFFGCVELFVFLCELLIFLSD